MVSIKTISLRGLVAIMSLCGVLITIMEVAYTMGEDMNVCGAPTKMMVLEE